jgi:hypothetical protein
VSTVPIRKSVVSLTLADLATSPVWEFALDEEDVEGQDETTVRPYAVDGPLDPAAGMFVVRARFALADGTLMSGYLTPPVQGEARLNTFQPIVVTPVGHVVFWCGMIVPDAATIAENYLRLGKTDASKGFPLRFESAVPLKCGTIKGQVPGFVVLVDFKTMRTRVVQ